jgi:hypothetical protein
MCQEQPPAEAYDGCLAAIRSHADDLGNWLGTWVNRSAPDAHARRSPATVSIPAVGLLGEALRVCLELTEQVPDVVRADRSWGYLLEEGCQLQDLGRLRLGWYRPAYLSLGEYRLASI